MKITLLLFLTVFLLSVSPPRKPRVSKEIKGSWVFLYQRKIELGKDGLFHLSGEFKCVRMQMPDNNYIGYEFRKKGELIVSWDPFYFCGTSQPEYESFKGKWIQLSDSTIRVTYEKKNQKITETHCLFRNDGGELQLKSIDTLKLFW